MSPRITHAAALITVNPAMTIPIFIPRTPRSETNQRLTHARQNGGEDKARPNRRTRSSSDGADGSFGELLREEARAEGHCNHQSLLWDVLMFQARLDTQRSGQSALAMRHAGFFV